MVMLGTIIAILRTRVVNCVALMGLGAFRCTVVSRTIGTSGHTTGIAFSRPVDVLLHKCLVRCIYGCL